MKKIALLMLLSLTLTSPMFGAEQQESTINVDTTINREYAPDTAKIRFYVENSGMNLADLKEKNDKIVNEAITKIKAKLNSNEQIKTIAFSVRNVYSYKDKVRIFQKYEVKNGFEVKLKDLDKVSDIINTAMASGVKSIGQLNFTIEDTDAKCNEMLAESAKLAKARANHIAGAVGSQLDKVKSINPFCSLDANRVSVAPRYYKAAMSGASVDSAVEEQVETIEPGTISARASINMIYYLK